MKNIIKLLKLKSSVCILIAMLICMVSFQSDAYDTGYLRLSNNNACETHNGNDYAFWIAPVLAPNCYWKLYTINVTNDTIVGETVLNWGNEAQIQVGSPMQYFYVLRWFGGGAGYQTGSWFYNPDANLPEHMFGIDINHSGTWNTAWAPGGDTVGTANYFDVVIYPCAFDACYVYLGNTANWWGTPLPSPTSY